MRRKVPVIVRTVDDTDLDKLQGRRRRPRWCPKPIEGALMLAGHALALVGVPMRRVIRIARDARDARYGLLRGYFHGADDDTVEELQQARLQSVTLPEAARCLGQTLGDAGAACGRRQRGVGAPGAAGGDRAAAGPRAGRRRHAGAVGAARAAGAGRGEAAARA